MPLLPHIQTRRRAVLPRPVKVVFTVRVPGPLFPLNPFHQLLRLWWLFLDPRSAQAYPTQHGTKNAERLDWWITCTWVFLIGLGIAIFSVRFSTGQVLYTAIMVLGLIVSFFLVGAIGSIGLIFNLVAALLLGFFASSFLYIAWLGIPAILNILGGLFSPFGIGVTLPLNVNQILPSPQTVALLVGLLAMAMTIAPQVAGWRSSKLYILLAAPIGLGAVIMWMDSSQAALVGEAILLFVTVWIISFVFLRLRAMWTRLVYISLILFLALFGFPRASAIILPLIEHVTNNIFLLFPTH